MKLFLDKIGNYSISTASKKPMVSTRSDQQIRRNLRISENRFFTQKCIFLSKSDIFSLIECTTLFDVNSQLLIQFEDLQMENLIKINFLPFRLPIDKTIVIEGTFREMLITLSKMKISLCTIDMAEVRHHL